jgi:hypothetical protein
MAGEAIDIQVGVILPQTAKDVAHDLDDTGHQPAFGRRDRSNSEGRVVALGHQVLQATARAIGREVAFVVGGVVDEIDNSTALADGATGSYAIDTLEMTFGVKAALGAGKAIEAFLTASSEATVEVQTHSQAHWMIHLDALNFGRVGIRSIFATTVNSIQFNQSTKRGRPCKA